ncbi:MAG: hypothetical protein K5989_02180, partial [Lachnospiraceae bacterium]|nr:hypothetical protein [Lachnospiraceae bacterium]
MKCFKKITVFLLCLCIICGNINPAVFYAQEISGEAINVEGFQRPIERPDASSIKIKTADDLQNISQDLSGSYVLANDIDMADLTSSWSPIGNKSNPFKGKLDGQGHTIKNFQLTKEHDSGWGSATAAIKSNPYATGLFEVLNEAEIKNLRIEGADISSTYTSGYVYQGDVDGNHGIYVGILAAIAENSTVIYNCIVSGSANNNSTTESQGHVYTGGFVGWSDSSALADCCFINGSISSKTRSDTGSSLDAIAGGLAGKVTGSSIIERSYNAGSISAEAAAFGKAYSGGLVGYAQDSAISIKNSYNSGTIAGLGGDGMLSEADIFTGGIAGVLTGSLTNVYNSGNVTANSKELAWGGGGDAYAGGLVGSFSGTCSVKNSALATSVVRASSGSAKKTSSIGNGSFTGENNAQTSNYTGSGATSYNYASFKTREFYENTLQWDFDSCWEMPEDDYPILKTELVSSDSYKTDYLNQHLAFVNSPYYQSILNHRRWAQTYWSIENNFVSNTAERLYKVLDATVNVLSLDIKELIGDIVEEDSFKLVLADYVTDQTTVSEIEKIEKLEAVEVTKKTYKKFESFVKKYWKNEWGDLSDEDLFYLFHYHTRPSEQWITSNFEEHLEEIVQETKDSAESLDTVLG